MILIKSPELNINKIDKSGKKYEKINDELFKIIFNMKKNQVPNVINFQNEYFLAEITKIEKIKKY